MDAADPQPSADPGARLRAVDAALYRHMVESATDYAIFSMDLDRRITSWNAGAERLLGWSEAEILGLPADVIFTPEDCAIDRPAVEQHGALRDGRASDDRWHMRKDGSRFFANGSMLPLIDDAGVATGLFKILRDHTSRHQAETSARDAAAALAESEARFRNMADNAPMMMWTTDADGRCTYLNRPWYDFTGQTAAEAEGMGWLDATHPDDQARTEAMFLEANAAQRRFRVEYRLRRADGGYHWCIDAAAPRFGPDGVYLGYIGSVLDIHERREAEERVRESEARLRGLTDAIPGFAWTADEDGIVDYASGQFFDFAGVPATGDKRETNRAWIKLLHPDDVAGMLGVWRTAREQAAPYSCEYRLRRRDGVYRWFLANAAPVDAGGSRVRWAGVSSDIEDIVRTRQALVASREALEREAREREAILAQLTEGVIVTDAQGRIVFVNDAAERLHGVKSLETPPEAYAETYHLFTEDGGPHPFDTLPLARAVGGETVLDARWRIQRPNGTEVLAIGGARPLLGADGEQVGAVLTLRDDTARRAAEADLRHLNRTLEQRVVAEVEERNRAEEQLRQSQKMEAVGQLTGGIAHDFNNLLAGIVGSLDMLSRRIEQGRTTDLPRYVTTAMTSAQRAAALTQRLLAFARRQPLDPKAVEANRLLAGMEELLRRTLGPEIALEMVLAGGLWPTLADPNQLENALLNLAINARDAMPEGGRLTIETANSHLDDAYARAHPGEVEAGQYIVVCVTDTGTGMPPETAARVFEPFFTTKPIGRGTGLGLSMLYGFAKQTGGHVKVYSEEGEGTTFRLYLPRWRGETAAETEPAAEIARDGAGQTVLLVEDEPAVRMLILETLDDLGYNAIEATDGPTGLRVLDGDRRVDLLVTDVGLPGMNGRQLAEAAREKRPGLKVLFITGYAHNAALGNGMLAPGTEILTKPFAVDALAAKIGEMLAAGAVSPPGT